jgi:hypothetical protein
VFFTVKPPGGIFYLILQGQTFIVSLVKPVAYLSMSYPCTSIGASRVPRNQ